MDWRIPKLLLFVVLGQLIFQSVHADDVVSCAENTTEKRDHIVVRFMRHGWSCTQCCKDLDLHPTHPNWASCIKVFLQYKDPLLTAPGVAFLQDKARQQALGKCLPSADWTLMSSAAARSIETALLTFPTSPVTVIPYVKECALGDHCPLGDGIKEDELSDNPNVLMDRLKGQKLDVSRVTFYSSGQKGDDAPSVTNNGQWTEAAKYTSWSKFQSFITSYAKAKQKRKFLLVTHSLFMGHILKSDFKQKVPDAIANAEIWEVLLDLNGNLLSGTTPQRVYRNPASSSSCKPMSTAQFAQTISTCDWKQPPQARWAVKGRWA